ncbi:hypothetical protein [Sporichthya polymorpha]|uniref:hypothetical protein n=1 Tax=Sporichthya polymorpha TaxID=35751 RepID=UPI000361F806|nr:hypothetical protein [Sporichthya polymorpha]
MNQPHSELRSMLDSVAGPPRPAREADVAGDLTRGHSALRRRRLTLVTNGTLALAVVGGLVVASTGAFDGSSTPASPAVAAPAVELGTDTTSAIQFVAYSGRQPEGFSVETIPDGWKLQGVNEYVLLVVPPSGADPSLDVFKGKIAVMLESQDASGPYEGSEIAVGDRTGVLSRMGDGYGQLHWTDAKGNNLVVQWPDTREFTDEQMAAFAAGVTVTGDAKAGRG